MNTYLIMYNISLIVVLLGIEILRILSLYNKKNRLTGDDCGIDQFVISTLFICYNFRSMRSSALALRSCGIDQRWWYDTMTSFATDASCHANTVHVNLTYVTPNLNCTRFASSTTYNTHVRCLR